MVRTINHDVNIKTKIVVYIYLSTLLACYDAVALTIQKSLLKISVFSLNEKFTGKEIFFSI